MSHPNDGPDNILATLYRLAPQRSDEMLDGVHAVIDDIQFSYALALSDHTSPETLMEIQRAVSDYVANYYGED